LLLNTGFFDHCLIYASGDFDLLMQLSERLCGGVFRDEGNVVLCLRG